MEEITAQVAGNATVGGTVVSNLTLWRATDTALLRTYGSCKTQPCRLQTTCRPRVNPQKIICVEKFLGLSPRINWGENSEIDFRPLMKELQDQQIYSKIDDN